MKMYLFLILMLLTMTGSEALLTRDPVPLEKLVVLSHKKHLNRGYKCLICHPKVTESDNAGDRNLPTEATCRVCHDGVIIDNSCTLCHQNMLNLTPIPNPERDIIFSHKLHLMDRQDCVACHGYGITQTDYCRGEFLPQMSICSDCHDGEQTDNECEICHGNVPRQNLRPENHNEMWLHGHRSEARDNRDECSMCHAQASCQDCHQGYNIMVEIHEKDYLLQHALEARLKFSDCTTCHDSQEFCQSCHEDEGVSQPLNHLTDFDWAESGHARPAIDNVEICAACHGGSASVCIDCHYEGSGYNPHPADYGSRLGKGPWHEDKTYMCYDCHFDQEEMQAGFCGYCHL